MKSIAAVLILAVVGAHGQNRPFYAPRPVQYPTLLSRFGGNDGDLGNRIGEDNSQPQRPIILVGGSVVDQDLIDRVSSWPADKQPFWYINSQAIQNHVYNPPNFNLPPPQSSFVSGKK